MSFDSRISCLGGARLGWALVALSLAGAGACAGDADGGLRLPPGTPVILVVIDTLRADHLSCYGYELPTSPVIDALARESLLFERNTTQCNATFPSLTSIMTGLYVKTHRNYLAVPVDGMVLESQGAACLAERFSARGYHTMAAISHPTWAGEDDAVIMRGWKRVTKIDPELSFDQRSLLARAEHTHERLFPLLEEYARDERDHPLFLWAHYFDPHTDLPNVYDAPEPFRNLWLAHHTEAMGVAEWADDLAPLPPSERNAWIEANVPAEQRRKLFIANGRALYDAEISACDAALGELFDRLRAMDVWDDAVVIVMADHGENMESEAAGHGTIVFSHKRLFEGVVHTPFLLRLPHTREGRRVTSLVQNVDLAPTLVELLDLPREPAFEGTSLMPILAGVAEEVHEHNFVETSDHIERGVKTQGLKYLDQGEFDEPLI
jgi:arylsulfatase